MIIESRRLASPSVRCRKRTRCIYAAAVIVLIAHSGTAAALEPTVTVDVETPARPVVNGRTNLPDGTVLDISISNGKHLPDGARLDISADWKDYQAPGEETNFYLAEDRVEVAGGKFRTQKFSWNDRDLKPGEYWVEVKMPMQPPDVTMPVNENVRSTLGEYGEKLTGPLVFRERLGPERINNFVRYVSTFQVGRSPNAPAPPVRFHKNANGVIETVPARPASR